MKPFAAIMISVLLSGCSGIPSSLAPIAPEEQAITDSRIVGDWKVITVQTDPRQRPFISIGPADQLLASISQHGETTYRVVFESDESSIAFDVQLHQLGDDTLLTLQTPISDDPGLALTTIHPYFPVRCLFQAEQIRLTALHEPALIRRLKERQLPYTRQNSSVLFTGSSEQLQSLLREDAATLFPLRDGDVLLERIDLTDSANGD